MPPVVAVVTTCFNQVNYIKNILEAVTNQETEARVLHIIVDDDSRDGSYGVLREYEDSHDHVRVLRVTNRGGASAFNAGLMALPDEVEYVVIIGGDDWFENNFISECLSAIGDAHAVVPQMRRVTSPNIEGWEGSGVLRSELPEIRNPTVEQLWEWNTTYAYGVAMFRREVLVEMGGYHPGVGGDYDWDLWIDFANRGYKFAYTDKTCFYYLYLPNSSCRTKTQAIWDQNRLEMRRHHRRKTLPGPEFNNWFDQ
ncbi:MAG: glycosyltransferase family 2 protein [Parcubacteria group bacterium]